MATVKWLPEALDDLIEGSLIKGNRNVGPFL